MAVTNSELGAYINALTEDTTPDTANDLLLEYDASASALKKVKMTNVASGTGGIGDHGVQVRNSTGPLIANNTLTALAFDTEVKDTDAYHSTSVNNSRLTVPTGQAGTYILVGSVGWGPTAAGERFIGIRVNGNTWIAVDSKSSGLAAEHYSFVTTIFTLAETDYAELMVRQQSGGNLGIASTAYYSPEFRMQRIA